MRNLHAECGLPSMVPALIVSRHPATIAWLKETFSDLTDAPVVSENVSPVDVTDKIVVGNLPLHLAAACHQYVAVEFTGAPPRGQEYNRADMEAAGVYVQPYVILRGARKGFVDHLVDNGFSGILPL